MRILLFLALIILGACSKSGSRTELKITRAFAFSADAGGMLLYITNKTTLRTQAVYTVSDSYSLVLDNGKWEIRVLGWTGSAPFSGDLFCGMGATEISGQDVNLSIRVNSDNCSGTGNFSPSTLAGKTLKLISCDKLTTQPALNSACDGNAQGNSQSYKLKLLAYADQLNSENPPNTDLGLESACISASSGTSVTDTAIKLPFGNGSIPFATILESYADPDCAIEETKKSFYFPRGIAAAPAGAYTLSNSSTADLYVVHGGLRISGTVGFTPVMPTQTSSQVFTLTNNSDLSVTGITASVVAPFSLTSSCGTLAPNQSCSISVTFAPSIDGSYNSALTVSYYEGIPKSLGLSLTGSASSVALLTASQPSLALGSMLQGAGALTQSFTIMNTGGVSASAVSLAGITSPFTLGHNCPASLSPGASCSLTVSLPGTSPVGSYSGAISVSYNNGLSAPVLSVPVSGEIQGTPALLSVSPGGPVALGNAPQNSGILSTTLALTNSGGLTASTLSVGTTDPKFMTTTTCTGTLAPGGGCSITVSFDTNITAGSYGSDLTLSFHDGFQNKTVPVPLSASVTAVNAPPVAQLLTPPALNEDADSFITLPYTDAEFDQATSCQVTNLVNVTETSTCFCSLGSCTVGVRGTLNFNGTASFDYTVTTGTQVSNIASASLTISAVDDAPVANNISPPAFSASTQSFITLSYSDADSDLATSCAVTAGANIYVSSLCSCSAGVCTVGISGSSLSGGTATFSYTVSTGAISSNIASASLTLIAAPAYLSFTPATLSFGSVPQNSAALSSTVSVTNTGGQAASSLTLGSLAAPYARSTTCGTSLAPGSSCSVNVSFNPTLAIGPYTQSLNLTFNDGSNPSVIGLSLAGQIQSPPPVVLIGTNFDFGPVNIGSVAVRTFTLTNNSGMMISYTLAGLTSELIQDPTGTCAGFLNVGASCVLKLRFQPSSVGNRSFPLVISYRDAEIGLTPIEQSLPTMTASGIPLGILSLTPTPQVLFGEVSTASFADRTINVTNNSDLVATNLNVGIFDPSFSRVGGDCTATLAARSSCTVVIRLTTSSAVLYQDWFILSYQNGTQTESVATGLSGRGIFSATVMPYFTNATQWNDYVRRTTSMPLPSELACVATTDTDCIHGGEARAVQIPGSLACSNFVGDDTLGVFEWKCAPGNLMVGRLKPDKGLRDLVTATGWKQNSFNLTSGGVAYLRTPLSTWWANPVVSIDSLSGSSFSSALPISLSGGVMGVSSTGSTTTGLLNSVDLTQPGTIYTISTNLNVPSLHLGNKKIAVVTLGTANLSTMNDGTRLTADSTLELTGTPSTSCVVCIGSSGGEHFWIELSASGVSSVPALALLASKFSKINGSRFYNSSNGINIREPKSIEVLSTRVHNNFNSGIDIQATSAGKVRLQMLEVFSNAMGGVVSNGPIFLDISDTLLHSHPSGSSGINLNGAQQANLNFIKSMNNSGGAGIKISNLTKASVSNTVTSGNNRGLEINQTQASVTSLLTTSNASDGLLLNNTSANGSTIMNVTAAANGGNGVTVSSNSNAIINVLSVNNGMHGIQINGVSNALRSIAVAHNAQDGIFFPSTSVNNSVNVIITGMNGTYDCESMATGNLINGIAASGPSCTLTVTGLSLAGSFRGLVTLDSANFLGASLGSGVVTFTSITDFSHFENLYRSWGKADSTVPYANPLASAVRGACSTGTNCSIWDWGLTVNSTNPLLNKTQTGLTSNEEINLTNTLPDGSVICPSYLHLATTDTQSTPNLFLTFAVEDQRFSTPGDKDGLCEAGETCVHAPNFGAYQDMTYNVISGGEKIYCSTTGSVGAKVLINSPLSAIGSGVSL